MINIYKKLEKTKDNPYGIVEIKENELLDKPFLLCLSAQDYYDKSVFGLIREGAQAARVYTTREMAAGFKITDMPIDFLGLKFTKDENYKNNYDDIADNFVYPYLIQNGSSFEEIKKQAIKANFMTYCDGTFTYAKIEKIIKEKLQNLGLSESQVEEILHCFSLIALGTSFDTSNLYSSTITFVDVNDFEIETERTEDLQELIANKQQNMIYGTLERQNNYLVAFNGSGRHNVTEYLNDENIVKPLVCAFTSLFLEHSIHGEVPSKEEIIKTLKTYGIENESTKTLLSKLDAHLSYDGASKYTSVEASLREELDGFYKQFIEMQKSMKQLEYDRDKNSQISRSLLEGINQYSSDVTRSQILAFAGLNQYRINEEYLSLLSDREIRAMSETRNNEEQDSNIKR